MRDFEILYMFYITSSSLRGPLQQEYHTHTSQEPDP